MADKWEQAQSTIPWHILRDEPDDAPPKGVIAGRVVPTSPPTPPRLPRLTRETVTKVAAAILLPVLAGASLYYGLTTIQAAPVPAATPPVVAEPTPIIVERVVEVQASPVVIVVTATPQAVQVAPFAPRQAVPQPQPQARPVQAQAPAVPPTARPVQTQAQAAPRSAPAPTAGPQERLLGRPCQFPDAPQGTVIKGYYTDPSGVKRDAICKPDGWKAAD